MKTEVKLFLILGFMIVNSCTQNQDIKPLLDNHESRHEIFNTITGNHDLMMSFMKTMQSNNHAMQLLQDNPTIMGDMMYGGGMQMMMKDDTMMSNMIKMMDKEGLMSKECLKTMTKITNDRRMTIKGMNVINQEEDKKK